MRKLWLSIIVVCLVAILLVGCGVQPQTPANQPAQGDGDNDTEVNTDKEQNLSKTNLIWNYERANEYSPTGRTWEEEDEYILSMWEAPTIERDFEENKITLLFRYYVDGEVGFDYFQDLIGTQVVEFHDLSTSITQTGETISLHNNSGRRLSLQLSTNDKQIVLDTCIALMSREEVLIADPVFIYDLIDCEAPTDTYYNLRYALQKVLQNSEENYII